MPNITFPGERERQLQQHRSTYNKRRPRSFVRYSTNSRLMKNFIATAILAFITPALFGQQDADGVFLQTNSKTRLYYVHLNISIARVFQMGSYLDVAGRGYSIKEEDTLTRQADGTYSGNNIRMMLQENKWYLLTRSKKPVKLVLDRAKNLKEVNHNLNNAYYLDNYFEMSNELNQSYRLNHHSFRNGFLSWKELPNQETDHFAFRNFADQQLKMIRDSISSTQNSYVSLMSGILQNLKTIEYDSLKDSLSKLPLVNGSVSRYYATVLNQLASQKPEYFFRLAEDSPALRSSIFSAVEDNEAAVQNLKTAKGHDEIKKQFFKDRRFSKTMPYRIAAMYAVVGGLLTWLILSQK